MPPSAVFAGMPGDGPDGPSARAGGSFGAAGKEAGTDAGWAGSGWTNWKNLDLAFVPPESISGWLIAAGSGIAALAFLLPWSNPAIEARSFGGYTDSWGLASPSHFLVLVAALLVLALAVLPNPVPRWLRTEVASLVLGGLLLGFAWPYLLGGWPGGAGIGILVEAIGGALLLGGGILSLLPTRHAEDPAGV
jgi:hypothetical protein